MTTLTHIAAELFELAGEDAEHAEYPCRRICREILIRATDDEPIRAHTLSVTPDAIEIDCKEELDPRTEVQIRLADGPDDAWCPAVVQHCVGTIIGYTAGLLITGE